MHKKCNFYPLSLFYLGMLYGDFKNQWTLSRTRRKKRSTIITEQRVKTFSLMEKKIIPLYYFHYFSNIKFNFNLALSDF